MIRAGLRSRSRRALLGAAPFALCLLPLGCGTSADPTARVQCTLQLEPQPPRVGAAVADLELREDGQPLGQAVLHVQGNMNHAGMVPSEARVTELAAGHYRAEFEFSMGGDWFLLVEGRLADGRSFERTLDVRGVAPR